MTVPPARSSPEPSGRAAAPGPRRWWALGALAACMLMLGFDLTVVNAALPDLADQLGADTGEMQWIVEAYLVVFAAAMLPAGLLGDRFGRRRLLLVGLALMLLGSTAGVLAGTPAWLVAARSVMGLGAALISPLALSVLPSLFGGAERTRAVGVLTAAMAAGMPLGPVAGGWLLDRYWWGSVFLLHLPLAAFGLAACALLLPESRDTSSPRVDAPSALLSAAALGALVCGVIEGPVRGWGDPLVIGLCAAAVLLLVALVLRERRVDRPMIDLELLARRGFLWNAVAVTLVTAVLGGLLFMLPQYLSSVLGYDALGTGLRLMPLTAGVLVAVRAAGPLVASAGPRLVICGGLMVLAFAAFQGARTGADDGYALTAAWLAVAGLGTGFAMVPAMDAALEALPPGRSGGGSGLLMTMRQTGAALGVALLGSLLTGAYRDGLDTGGLPRAAADAARESLVGAQLAAERFGSETLVGSARSAFMDGMHLVLVVCGLTAMLSALLVALTLPPYPAPRVPGGSRVAPVRKDARQ